VALIHWLKAANGTFDVAANWNGGNVPDAGDVAVIDAPGSADYTVTAGAPQTLAGLQMAANPGSPCRRQCL
jgi:hypothetical protein